MHDALSRIEQLSENDSDLFRAAIGALFSGSFLIRSVEGQERLYRFVIQNYPLFEAYVAAAGWSLRKDENLGVIAWQGPPAARLSLGIEESILLMVLRLAFEEKVGEMTLHGERTLLQQELQDKFRTLSDRQLKKTRLVGILRRFQSLKLLRVLGDEADPEATIILYPSIPFALDGQSIEDLHARITSYSGGNERSEGDDRSTENDGPEDIDLEDDPT